ncbi:nickel-dependent lactate racemase [Clostridium bovifaecis]|uniref:Nickel-dependent lactate racemase n=1 Tax=Clostridium bovifaecis TaxID=2184719 RepID=A0A6I6F4S1_9CLOT|nr:nickel-dependent lactate racemase [Clostridium bovifaecis]
MLNNYSFKYGSEIFNLELNDENILAALHSKELKPIENLEKKLNYLLDNPIGTKPFDEVFEKMDEVLIVVSDVTRLWIKTASFLSIIIDRLNRLGIEDRDITIIVATGTHRGQTVEEHKLIVGEKIYERITVLDHDCDGEMVYCGTTSRGTEVEVNKIIEGKKIILTGGIVHHLMAGFGGGRKSILPGIASRRTINQNHLHALSPDEPCSNPLIGVGVLADNPLNYDMIEAAALVKPDFLVNSIVDTSGNIVHFVAGHFLKAWESGCKWTDENFGVKIQEKADIVIASCGGYPKDINLYQSTKSLFNAALALKDGGTMILLAECIDGAGADSFFSWIEPLKRGELDNALREGFTIPGYIFYASIESSKNANVVLVTSIDAEMIKPMGMKAVRTLEEALKLAGVADGYEDKKIILMPYAGSTVPLYNKK